MKTKFLIKLILPVAAASFACGGGAAENQNAVVAANTSAANAANKKPDPPKNPQTPFEKVLFNVRTGDFDQVLSFSRKDDKVLTTDDIEFFKANTEGEPGRELNRRLKSDDNKFIVTGTNFPLKSEQFEKLQQRFQIRDYTESNAGAEFDLNRFRAEESQRAAKARGAADKQLPAQK